MILAAAAYVLATAATSYGDVPPMPPVAPLASQIATLAERTAKDRRAAAPKLDARLCQVAALLAEVMPPNGRLSSETIESALRLYGIVEPSPHLIVAHMDTGGDRELLADLARQLPRAMSDGDYRRLGVGIATARDQQHIVLILGESFIELGKIPRALPSGGPAKIEGKLHASFQKPSLMVTPPVGAVEKLSITGDARGFRGTFHCGTARGPYQIEVIGEGATGPTVLANFPIYCGMAAPQHLDVRAADEGGKRETVQSAETTLLSLLNVDRVRAHLPPLQLEPALSNVARAHSEDMAAHGFVGHVSPTTGDAQRRVQGAKIDALSIRENVSRASTPRETEQGLMNSPGHRANILATDVTHVGIGVAFAQAGDERALLATQLFIRKPVHLDPGAAQAALKRRIAEIRKPLGLSAFVDDPALTRAAQSAAEALARAPSDRSAASRAMETALASARSRFGTIRTMLVIAAETNQLDAQTSPMISDGRSRFAGFAAVPTVDASGARGFAFAVVLAEPR